MATLSNLYHAQRQSMFMRSFREKPEPNVDNIMILRGRFRIYLHTLCKKSFSFLECKGYLMKERTEENLPCESVPQNKVRQKYVEGILRLYSLRQICSITGRLSNCQ